MNARLGKLLERAKKTIKHSRLVWLQWFCLALRGVEIYAKSLLASLSPPRRLPHPPTTLSTLSPNEWTSFSAVLVEIEL